jgi:hypothetical protein
MSRDSWFSSFRIPLLIFLVVTAAVYTVGGHSDAADFGKGVMAGIWLGILILAAIWKARANGPTA